MWLEPSEMRFAIATIDKLANARGGLTDFAGRSAVDKKVDKHTPGSASTLIVQL